MQNVHFTPPQLASLFKVNVSTIKRWVDRGMLESIKTPGGHRRITQEQLNAFIKKYPKYDSQSYILQKLSTNRKNQNIQWKEYFVYLRNDLPDEALKVIEQSFLLGTDLPTILDELITPTLQEIGREWQNGKLSIYEEHRMSFVMRQHLHSLDRYIPKQKKIKKKRALLACAPHDHHEIPLLMVGLILKTKGYDTCVLGINVPLNEIKKAQKSCNAEYIAISKTYSQDTGATFYTRLDNYCKKTNTRFIVGGSGWGESVKKKKAYIPSMHALAKTVSSGA
ncbi:MAG: helix-turn-helix domain-containing protein [Patescibacteria group bacterium]